VPVNEFSQLLVTSLPRRELSCLQAAAHAEIYENGDFGDVASGEDEEADEEGGDNTDEEVNDKDESSNDSDDEKAAANRARLDSARLLLLAEC
jgi:hypothetical protein